AGQSDSLKFMSNSLNCYIFFLMTQKTGGQTDVWLPPCTHNLAGCSNTYCRPMASIFISAAPSILQCRKTTGRKGILFILVIFYSGLTVLFTTFMFSSMLFTTKVFISDYQSLNIPYVVIHRLKLKLFHQITSLCIMEL
uniref:Uncharacterized protein n=1 Tax=Athene cunicularia TaxID=194338 RepID=A0A663LWW1_ATHCN